MKINGLESILNEFRESATSKRDMGDKFERLVSAILKHDSSIAGKFKDIWLWSDFPYRDGSPDVGIDLVGVDESTGEYVAIQCKFYHPEHTLVKEDIDSFFTASGQSFNVKKDKKRYSRRIIVATTDLWSPHAKKALENQEPPVTKIGIQDLLDSSIDWENFDIKKLDKIKSRPKKEIREHQQEAIDKVEIGFKASDRGKLIMACGTGKTFTSLKLVEHLVPNGGQVLFLVPSIALLSQTLKEWMFETSKELVCFAVCSDVKVGKNDDKDMSVSDLALPATTDAESLVNKIKVLDRKNKITIIFSTYQSVEVIADAHDMGLKDFDLTICDEAHRTTGLTADGQEESIFQKVHDPSFIKSKKRLYMTATPRIYGEGARAKAEEASIKICDMSSEEHYGPEFHRLGFSQAVTKGLLTDYKVLVLGVDEKYINRAFQSQIIDENNELQLEDAVKIVGCWNGLAKKMDLINPKERSIPMKRAVAFSSTIANSKHIQKLFATVVDTHIERTKDESALKCEIDHVDGSMNVQERNRKLAWLKDEAEENTCRILTNAKCLSEGVDVPSLDAVMFLSPRNSIVDVVQSVGRVMRRSPGKDYGYIILPIGIPSDMEPEEALRDNEKYKVVWQVLNALRAHDDRFDAVINKIQLNNGDQTDSPILTGVIGGDAGEDESGETNKQKEKDKKQIQLELDFPHLEDWKNAIYAKMVQKCGSRIYWEDWAKKVAVQAELQQKRIEKILEKPTPEHKKAFDSFLHGLHENINPYIKKEEAIEMLAQHLVTRPVFEALFENYSFTKSNPISKAMQSIIDILDNGSTKTFDKEMESFYLEVKNKVSGINNFEGKQQIIKELYDKFFNHAFPKVADRLGIVYTPIEVVDFIINSVDEVLKQEFGKSISDEGINILDPFTGTGTFIVRLLQSGLIKKEDFIRKYTKELHANELVLLAYYIATINIEEAFHYITGANYKTFEGALLTDTFQMYENEGRFEEIILSENYLRIKKQKESKINVIIGNPPYSVGQGSENDNNQNLDYPSLDKSISDTYAKHTTGKLKKSLYDSYVRAFRWATDRIGNNNGIIAFVTNGSFIDGNTADGFRKCLYDEFTTIYCFNLKGNQRTSGEVSRKEGGKIFGSGSRTPVAISILVRNIDKNKHEIKYNDIGNYHSREEKLNIIKGYLSIAGVKWEIINPNLSHDWIDKRSGDFDKFITLGDKSENKSLKVFDKYSQGVLTSRDSWVLNFNKIELEKNVSKLVSYYNSELSRLQNLDKVEILNSLNTDPKLISWSRALKSDLAKGKKLNLQKNAIVTSSYRPFVKMHCYFDRSLNEMVYLMNDIFPKDNIDNLVISCTGIGANKEFSCLMTNCLPNFHFHDTGQCFPICYFDQNEIKSAINVNFKNEILLKLNKDISDKEIFFYVYGILHSKEYRSRFLNDLSKMIPRIPFAKDFWAFSIAGQELANLHLNYETVEPYKLEEVSIKPPKDLKSFYKVTKMKFPKKDEKSSIIYNGNVTLKGIPIEAYDYIVNGKSAIEWIMERYQVKTDKDSGILNDPNEYSDDPRYIIDLLKRIVTVSIETMKIVNSLPPLEEID